MKEKFVRFLKSNFIIWAFLAIMLIIELTGVCVTSGKFFIRRPFMFLSLIHNSEPTRHLSISYDVIAFN